MGAWDELNWGIYTTRINYKYKGVFLFFRFGQRYKVRPINIWIMWFSQYVCVYINVGVCVV